MIYSKWTGTIHNSIYPNWVGIVGSAVVGVYRLFVRAPSVITNQINLWSKLH